MRQQPRERELQNRMSARLGELDQRFDFVEILLGEKLSVALVLRDPRIWGHRLTLSVFHRLVQRAERLRNWNIGIGYVLLVKIDVIGAQSLEARVQCLLHVLWTRATTLAWHVVAEFGGDDHFSAATAEQTADQLLTSAVRIHVGGIEEADARIDGCINDLSGARLVDARAEVVTAEADNRDVERADLSRFHFESLYTVAAVSPSSTRVVCASGRSPRN